MTSPGRLSSWCTFLPAGGKSGHPSPAVLAGPSRDSCSLEGWGGGRRSSPLPSYVLPAPGWEASPAPLVLCALWGMEETWHTRVGLGATRLLPPHSSPDLWSQITPVSDTVLQILTLGEKLPINFLCLGSVRPRGLPGIQLPLGSLAVWLRKEVSFLRGGLMLHLSQNTRGFPWIFFHSRRSLPDTQTHNSVSRFSLLREVVECILVPLRKDRSITYISM